MIGLVDQINCFTGVCPVFNVNVTLLKVKWVEGHIQGAGSGKVPTKSPDYPAIITDVYPEVTCIAYIIDCPSTVLIQIAKDWKVLIMLKTSKIGTAIDLCLLAGAFNTHHTLM